MKRDQGVVGDDLFFEGLLLWSKREVLVLSGNRVIFRSELKHGVVFPGSQKLISFVSLVATFHFHSPFLLSKIIIRHIACIFIIPPVIYWRFCLYHKRRCGIDIAHFIYITSFYAVK